MDEDTPMPNPKPSTTTDSSSEVNEDSEKVKKSLSSEKLNLRAIMRNVICLLAIVAAIIFAKLWYTAQSETSQEVSAEAESHKKKIDELEKKIVIRDKELAQNIESYSIAKKESAQQFTADIKSKDIQITKLKSDIAKLSEEKIGVEQRWKAPLKDVIDISQDIYAMKWQENSRVLADMENSSARAVEICERWEQLCQKLEPYPEFAPQRAKLKVRLAQAYSGLGFTDKINFEAIDWEMSGLSAIRHEIEAHVWYKVAEKSIRLGKLEEAKKYSALAMAAANSIKNSTDDLGKKDYYMAMTHLLNADLLADSEPGKAMASYLLACENLSKISILFPTNSRVKDAFIQACIDGSILGESVTNAGNSEKLTKDTYIKILALMGKKPKVKKTEGKSIIAEAKIHEAEKLIKAGDHFNAQKAVAEARTLVKKSGGNVLLTASIDSTQAFIFWDHGQHTKALGIIDNAIARVKKFKSTDSKNQEIIYSLASLHWSRSSMRIQPTEAIQDGQIAVTYLAELVRKGAGKREAAARRMIAIIYSDIGEQAYVSDQKKVAKQYFFESKKQWEYLSRKWGTTDEYKEGIRWCKRRIKSL